MIGESAGRGAILSSSDNVSPLSSISSVSLLNSSSEEL